MNIIAFKDIERTIEWKKELLCNVVIMGNIAEIRPVEICADGRGHRLQLLLDDIYSKSSFEVLLEGVKWPNVLANRASIGRSVCICLAHLEMISSAGPAMSSFRYSGKVKRAKELMTGLFPFAMLAGTYVKDQSRLEEISADIWNGGTYLRSIHRLGESYRIKQVITWESPKPPSLSEIDEITKERQLQDLIDQQIVSTKANHYEYTAIDELKVGMMANVYGFVRRYTEPKRTRGTDLMMTICLVDRVPTTTELTLVLFRHSMERLPLIQSTGDIMRCHRLKIQKFEGRLQGICDKGFSFSVVSGTIGSKIEPRVLLGNDRKPQKVNLGMSDIKKIVHLRKLARQYRLQGSMNQEQSCIKFTPINELVIGGYANVIGVVLAVLPGRPWDYTTILISDFTSHCLSKTEIDTFDLLHDVEVRRLIAHCGPKSVLPVIAWDEHATQAKRHLSKGMVVYFQRGYVKLLRDNRLALILHGKDMLESSLEIPDESDATVLRLKRYIIVYEELLKKKPFKLYSTHHGGYVFSLWIKMLLSTESHYLSKQETHQESPIMLKLCKLNSVLSARRFIHPYGSMNY
jgi:hypothetical protein